MKLTNILHRGSRLILGLTLLIALMAVTVEVKAQSYTCSKYTYFKMDDDLNIVDGSESSMNQDATFTWSKDHKSFVHKTPTGQSTYTITEKLDSKAGEAYKVMSDAGNEYYFQFNDNYVTTLSKKDKFSLVYTVDSIDKNTTYDGGGNSGNSGNGGKRKGVWKD